MKRLNGVLVDAKACESYELEFNDDLDTFYELIGCRVIDVARRKINGKWYAIVVDDEGLLKGDQILSAMSKTCEENVLVGNLIVLKENSRGEFESLTEAEADEILDSIVCYLGTDFEVHHMLRLD